MEDKPGVPRRENEECRTNREFQDEKMRNGG